jgi:hypothetical protein
MTMNLSLSMSSIPHKYFLSRRENRAYNFKISLMCIDKILQNVLY